MFKKSKLSPFYQLLTERIRDLGGMHNAHLHLDRAYTLNDAYMADAGHQILDNSHISLHKKHNLINALHNGPAYDADDLNARVNGCLDVMIDCNTVRADTMVDVTNDRVGLSAIELLTNIKHRRKNEIDLRLGAYSPFGFKPADQATWDIFEDGVKMADFIGSLPEADDTDDYPDHIGFMAHCERILDLSQKHQCMVHVHTDQRNESSENGTERLIQAVNQFGAPDSQNSEPLIWAVHMISPSTYDESRFQALIDGLLNNNIGVICCPSAAIGMRQLRPLKSPTYNSIPRVLELATAGVHIRLASDNISDICSPSTTENLMDEIFVLSAALRYYNIDILAKMACGLSLSDTDRTTIKKHLEHNSIEIEKVLGEKT